jgi:hypothetical protein
VLDRESTFSNPQVVKLLQDRFITVAADDWYERRRDDEVGKFFVGVANQGPRKGEGGSTRQGIYCFSASGKLLAFRNNRDPETMLGEFNKALAKYDALPADERKAGAFEVPKLAAATLDRRYTRKPPEGGIVVRVMTRALERDEAGHCKTCTASGTSQYGLLTSQDHLWLTRDEWMSLLPKEATVGKSFEMPKPLAMRIARFHLVDNTRGEPPMWKSSEVGSCEMTLTVVEATATRVKLRLDGKALLSTTGGLPKGDTIAKYARGYDAALLGYLEFDRAKPAVTRFDVVALGDHWGESELTRNARAGRAPLGVAMQLADGKQASDAVPPQAARDRGGYFAAEQ